MFRTVFSALVLFVFTFVSIAPALAAVEDDLAALIAAKEQRIQKKIEKIQEQKNALAELNNSIEKAQSNKIYYRIGGAAASGLGIYITYKSYKAMKSLGGLSKDTGVFAGFFMLFIELPAMLATTGGIVAGGVTTVGGLVFLAVPPTKVKALQDEISLAQRALADLEAELAFEKRELEQLKKQL